MPWHSYLKMINAFYIANGHAFLDTAFERIFRQLKFLPVIAVVDALTVLNSPYGVRRSVQMWKSHYLLTVHDGQCICDDPQGKHSGIVQHSRIRQRIEYNFASLCLPSCQAHFLHCVTAVLSAS